MKLLQKLNKLDIYDPQGEIVKKFVEDFKRHMKEPVVKFQYGNDVAYHINSIMYKEKIGLPKTPVPYREFTIDVNGISVDIATGSSPSFSMSIEGETGSEIQVDLPTFLGLSSEGLWHKANTPYDPENPPIAIMHVYPWLYGKRIPFQEQTEKKELLVKLAFAIIGDEVDFWRITDHSIAFRNYTQGKEVPESGNSKERKKVQEVWRYIENMYPEISINLVYPHLFRKKYLRSLN